MELTEEEHQRNRDILTNLIVDAPPEITTILSCYNYDENAGVIYKQLSKFKKPQLEDAANYLQQPAIIYKYKDQLIRGIMSRIDSLLLELCRKCEAKYSIEKDEVPILSCISCGQGCHTECYRDIIDVIKSHPGMNFMCHSCEAKFTKEKSNETQENTQTQQDQENFSQEDDIPSHQPPHSPQRGREEDVPKPTCQKYIRGTCPHGISGKKVINGEACFFNHPKRCMKFCRNGPYSRYGCDKGRDCEYLHPILCKFSLKFRKCTNLSCKFTHLKFTKRYDTENEQSAEDYYYSQNNTSNSQGYYSQNHRSNSQDQVTGFQSNPSHPSSENPNQNPFLENLPEILNQIQEELKQIKQQQNNRPPPPPPPPPIPKLPPHLPQYQHYTNLPHIHSPPLDLKKSLQMQHMATSAAASPQATNLLTTPWRQVQNQMPNQTHQ